MGLALFLGGQEKGGLKSEVTRARHLLLCPPQPCLPYCHWQHCGCSRFALRDLRADIWSGAQWH